MIIHGMGSQKEGFEKGLKAELIDRIDGDTDEIGWQAVYWQDITEPQQTAYLDSADEDADLDWPRTRRFMATALGDASAYQFTGTGGTYDRIHERIRDRMHDLFVTELESAEVPLVVLAHSLGGHMMSNYIWDMQPNDAGTVRAEWSIGLSPFERAQTHAGFVTFGCNIPLFSFAYDEPTPISFPGSALSAEDRERAAWLNFYDKDDVLGWPLRPLGRMYVAAGIEDREISVESPLKSWNPSSHTAYWADNSFTKPVAAFLSKFL